MEFEVKREKCEEIGLCVLTLLDTPVELRQNVVKQNVVEGLKVLGEDITDGIKCVVAGGGHPLCFLKGENTNPCEISFN